MNGNAASSVVRLQLTLAVTEAVGPMRLALTVALTPRVAGLLRGYPVGRRIEAFGLRVGRNSARRWVRLQKKVQDTLSKSSLTNRIL